MFIINKEEKQNHGGIDPNRETIFHSEDLGLSLDF